jgi:beta-1,4-mannosyl-glycoprotein beta-1,4-N-acetylglucosaminyltransferase
MIYDCFIFNGEFDVLDIRLNELADVVDRFVIIEGTHTFQDTRKPLYFDNHMDAYREFQDKIIYLTMKPIGQKTWDKEAYSRNFVSRALHNCQPDDIIMMSDVDEIPRATVVKTLDPQGIVALGMDEYQYSLNMWGGYWWFTRVCRYKNFPGGEALRRWNHLEATLVEDAGWHFTYLMSPEEIARKLESFSHNEYNLDHWKDHDRMRAAMRAGQDLFDRGTLERRHFDDHPRYVLDNLDRFGRFIL